MSGKKIAIIGAGVSGLNLSRLMTKHCNRAQVTVFDKSRGIGGRMSTRRWNGHHFDTGAQIISPRSRAFLKFIDTVSKNETRTVIQKWSPLIAQYDAATKAFGLREMVDPNHYIAVPDMNSLCRYLGQNQNVVLNTHIGSIQKDGATSGCLGSEIKWRLLDLHGNPIGDDRYDWVITTNPPQQSAHLFSTTNFEYKESLDSYRMGPVYALMVGLQIPPHLTPDAARMLTVQGTLVRNSPIEWVVVNSQKPLRTAPNGWASLVVHSTNAWAEEHMEKEVGEVGKMLLEELSAVLGFEVEATPIDTISSNNNSSSNNSSGRGENGEDLEDTEEVRGMGEGGESSGEGTATSSTATSSTATTTANSANTDENNPPPSSPPSSSFYFVHRWRYSNICHQTEQRHREMMDPTTFLRRKAYVDPLNQLGACGDWCLVRCNVESAYLSSTRMAKEMYCFL